MIKRILKPLVYIALDCHDWLKRFSAGKLYLPPRRLRDVGGDDLNDFIATGQEFLDHFVNICGLKPHEKVLEIGCGSGRIALPLTNYISEKGAYVGVEIVAPSIEWCKKNITTKNPNFTFMHADLYNKRYNPSAKVLAKDYCFPIDNDTFDFIYLTSVFTHLLPEDVNHYLQEIRRMLKPSGRVFMTFFLLNKEQEKLALNGKNQIYFIDMKNNCYKIRDKEIPESAVAYEERYLLGMLDDLGFTVQQPLFYGSWSGREKEVSFQDIIISGITNDK